MFDDLYSRMIEKADYRKFMLIPVVIAIVMLIFISVKGIPQGLDFAGGSWIEITVEGGVEPSSLEAIKNELLERGLENLDVFSGSELGTDVYKITISTTTVINRSEVDTLKNLLEGYVGELREEDIVDIPLSGGLNADVKEKLENRIRGSDVSFNSETSVLRITALDIDIDELKRSVKLYLGVDGDAVLQKKNFRVERIGKTLGGMFWEQSLRAVFLAYLLIIAVIFFVFRDFVPSIAIITAATLDGIFALGGMSVFGFLLEPAALVSLLMLIGYSVDSDILLTTRVLKSSKGMVNERIDSAMKTGLTMTGTTMGVMIIILVVTSTIIQVPALPSIAAVLLMGLIADLINTWFLNAGILKWYVEEKGGRFDVVKFIRRRR